MKKRLGQLFLLGLALSPALNAYQAVVISPIVDLVGTPLKPSEFRSIPLCGGQREPCLACKRGHQLLYNEIVEIVESTSDLVCVAVPNIFYITQNNNKKYNRYWAEKKHFVPLKDIADQSKLPHSLAPHKKTNHQENSITLTTPYRNNKQQATYSVGTRFARVSPHKNEKNILAWVLDPTTQSFDTMQIPAAFCYIPTHSDTQSRITDFVQLVRRWAHLKKGYIPYVWGGCSYTEPAYSPLISEKMIKIHNKNASFYCIDQYNLYPMSGLDCSSLVLRAAQICNIPYYFKNTTTLAYFLSDLKPSTPVEDGDLIWIPRHVMIVSNVHNNLLVEARSYNHGFGKVHELPLNRVFKNVHTYDDLVHRLFAKKPLERINKDGVVMDTFDTFKILKLKSVFNSSDSQ